MAEQMNLAEHRRRALILPMKEAVYTFIVPQKEESWDAGWGPEL